MMRKSIVIGAMGINRTVKDLMTDLMCEFLSDPANQKHLIFAIYEESDPDKLNADMQGLWRFINANIERIKYLRAVREQK